MRDRIRVKTLITWYLAMSVCLINLLLLGLINALIIKAIAMHWHNSIFLDQSIPHGQHARSEVFFWRSKVFSTLSRVARWYQQHWTKCTHPDSSNRAWRPKITHNRARWPKNAPSSCISNPCQPCFACLAEEPNIQCVTNIWPGLNRIATPVNFLPLVSESDLWSKPAIMARHPTCGRDTPICAGIHYVPIQIWRGLTYRRTFSQWGDTGSQITCDRSWLEIA